MATSGSSFVRLKKDVRFVHWDLDTGRELDVFTVPSGTIVEATFFTWAPPDGRGYYILTASRTDTAITRSTLTDTKSDDYFEFLQK